MPPPRGPAPMMALNVQVSIEAGNATAGSARMDKKAARTRSFFILRHLSIEGLECKPQARARLKGSEIPICRRSGARDRSTGCRGSAVNLPATWAHETLIRGHK